LVNISSMYINNRVFGLDILRAIAILIVLFTHCYGYSHLHFLGFIYKIIPDGVGLFFVLSGFLIGGIILRTINKEAFYFKNLTNFWVRRWLRTLPAYYFVITILFILQYLLHESKSIYEYLQYYLFIQSITDGTARLYGESWSLCIEEWFYLLIPFALFSSMYFSSLNRRKVILFWIFFTISSVTVLRCYRGQFISTPQDWDTFLRRALITRLDSIMYGFLGAYLSYYKYPIWEKKNALFIIGILLIIFNSVFPYLMGFGFYTKYLFFTIQSFTVLLFLPKLNSIKKGKGKIFNALTFISIISYSMYLLNGTPFHEFIIRSLRKIGLPDSPTILNDWTKLFAFMLWSFGGSWLLYRYVETPMMNLRNKISK
jgi:peptidoglycan/LPS O-acetylase OafA/YrhL